MITESTPLLTHEGVILMQNLQDLIWGKNKYVIQLCFKKLKVWWRVLIENCASSNVSVDILITCGKHLQDPIISLREEVWAHKTSLTPLFFIGVPVAGSVVAK
jgi:hypothetical protein